MREYQVSPNNLIAAEIESLNKITKTKCNTSMNRKGTVIETYIRSELVFNNSKFIFIF